MPDFIDLTGDDEPDTEHGSTGHTQHKQDQDETDLQLAIAMSLQHQRVSQERERVTSDLPADDVAPSSSLVNAPNTTASGLIGLDRRAMETERLARLKRKRDLAPSDEPCKHTRISPPPLQRSKIAERTSQPSNSTASVPSTSANPLSQLHRPSTRYQIVLTSHPSRYSKTGHLEAISFPDVLRPPENSGMLLKSALLSSYVADFEWLLPHFQTNKTGFVFVLHTHNLAHQAALQADFAGLPNVRLVLPKVMGGGGSMHSKIILLFFQGLQHQICRIVVPSANLTPYDWGIGSLMENVVWMVDLPAKSAQNDTSSSLFQDQLCSQLEAMNVPRDVVRKLADFDFRAVEDCRFIHSCSTSIALDNSASIQTLDRTDPKPAETGLLLLSAAVKSLRLATSTSSPSYPPTIDFVTSSLGNLTQDFVHQLTLAICGRTVHLPKNRVAKLRGAHKEPSAASELETRSMLHLYFPSADTVHKSNGGPGSAGTICFQRKWWDTNELIQDCLYDLVNQRDVGVLMHSKILYVRYRKPIQTSDDETEACHAGWAYVGSANCSESAWGRVTHGSKGGPRFTCRNWESGVLVPVKAAPTSSATRFTTGAEHVASTAGDGPDSDIPRLEEVFRDVVPVPMCTPGIRHKSAGRQPWFFTERA